MVGGLSEKKLKVSNKNPRELEGVGRTNINGGKKRGRRRHDDKEEAEKMPEERKLNCE